jgi:hypothetical protein
LLQLSGGLDGSNAAAFEFMDGSGATNQSYLRFDTVAGQSEFDAPILATGAVTVGVDGTGADVKFFGDTAGSFMLWDQSDDALELTDDSPIRIGDDAAGDMTLYHDGTDSHITNKTGLLNIATATSGVPVNIGHSTSAVTIGDDLKVKGVVTVGAGGDEFTITESSDDVTMAVLVSDKDLTITGNDGGATVSALIFDMSDAGRATFNNDIRVGVNCEVLGDLIVGAGGNEFSISESSDDIILKSLISDKDLTIAGNDGGANVNALAFDMSDAGRATFNNDIRVGVDCEVLGDLIVGAGANEFSISETSDNITMAVLVSDKDLTITGNDGGVTINALAFDMSDAGKATFSGAVVVTGNLTVNGTQTILDTATVQVEDPVMQLNYIAGAAQAGADSGIQVGRNGTTDALLAWEEASDSWGFGLTNAMVPIVGTTSIQTLTNKTLSSPDINSPDIDGGTIDAVTLGGTLAGTPTFSGVGTHSALDIFNAGLTVKNAALTAGFIEFYEDSDNGTKKVTLVGAADVGVSDLTINLPSLAGTVAVAATAASGVGLSNGTIAINIDGATDGELVVLADADKFLISNGGTEKYILASQISSYISAGATSKALYVATGSVAEGVSVQLPVAINAGNWHSATDSAAEVYLNGQLLLSGATAGTNYDYYQHSIAGELRFEFDIEVNDVLQFVLRS